MKERNRLLSGFLALILCFNLMAPAALAAEEVEVLAAGDVNADGVSLTYGTGTPGEKLGSAGGRVYLEGIDGLAIEKVVYSAAEGDEGKIEVDPLTGAVTLKSGFAIEDGETATVKATITYYNDPDQIFFQDNFMGAKQLDNTDNYKYSSVQSLFGRTALTPDDKTDTNGGAKFYFPSVLTPDATTAYTVSGWIYSPEPGQNVNEKFALGVFSNTNTVGTNVGILQTGTANNTSPNSNGFSGEFVTRGSASSGTWYRTNIARQTGWHRVSLEVTSAGTRGSIFINGETEHPLTFNAESVAVDPGTKDIKYIQVWTNWGRSGQNNTSTIIDHLFIDGLTVVETDATTDEKEVSVAVPLTERLGPPPLGALFTCEGGVLNYQNSGTIALNTDVPEVPGTYTDVSITGFTYDSDKLQIDPYGVVTLKSGYFPVAEETLSVTVDYTYKANGSDTAKAASTTVQVIIGPAPIGEEPTLTFGADNSGSLRKGQTGRVYLDNINDYAIAGVTYETDNPKVTVNAGGVLRVADNYAPQAGETVKVTAHVSYYSNSSDVIFADSFEGDKTFTTNSTGYQHSDVNPLFGRYAATATTTNTYPQHDLTSVSDVTVTAWYYDNGAGENGVPGSESQVKFGFGITGSPSSSDNAMGIFYDGVIAPYVNDLTRTNFGMRVPGHTYSDYSWGGSDVARTRGWHKLEWVIDSTNGMTNKIDGKVVSTNPAVGKTGTVQELAKVENIATVTAITAVRIMGGWNNNADNQGAIINKHFIDGVTVVKNGAATASMDLVSVDIPLLDIEYTHTPANPTVDATYPEPLTLIVKPNLAELVGVKVDDKELTADQWNAYLDNGPSNASYYPAELKGWKLTVASEALQDLNAGSHNLVLTMTSGSVYTIPFTAVANTHVPRSYYLSNNDGLDTNTGDSPDQAWKSFGKLSTVTFGPGDTIYLDAKSVWSGVQFRPNGSGAKGAPIVITKYNDDGDPSKRPILNGDGTVADRTAHSYLAFDSWRKFYPSGTIELFNVEHWEVRGVEITNYSGTVTQEATGRNGIAVIHDFFETQDMTALPTTDALKENAFYRAGKLQHIVIEDCYIHDVYGRHPANGASGAGSKMSGGINVYGPYDGLQIEKNIVMYCDVEGIRNDVLAWRGDTDTQFPHYMNDISISDNFIVGVPGDGVVISSAVQPRLANNYLSDAGYSYFATSASTSTTIKEMGNRQNPITMGATNFAGLWFIGTLDAVAEFNEAVNNVWTCQDGEAFDADMYCRGTVFQHNYTYRNNGGMILFMNSMYNGTIVRYNVSVEDGEGLGSAAGKKATFYYNGAPDAIYNNLFILGTNIKSMFGGSSSTVKFYNNMVVAPKANAAFHLNGNGSDDTASPGLTGEIKNNLFYPASILSEVTGSVVKADNITPASLVELPFYDLSAFMGAQPIQALLGRSPLTGASVGNMELGKGAGVAMTPEQGRSVKAPAGAGFDYAGFEGIKTVGSAGAGIPVVLPYGRTDAVYPLTYDFFKNPLTGGFIPEIGPYQWSADPSHYVRLSYEGNGAAETLAAEAVKSGSTHTLPTPTQAGKVFGGWYDNAALTGTAVSGSYTVPADSVTLYAKWGEDGPFTVTFDSQEGTSVDPIANVEKGTAISAPAVPTREGHTFGGWYKDSAGTEPWDFTTDTVTANITLYAKWTLNKYTVTFDSREGSAVQPIADVPHGTTISAPAVPTREGHAFLGWYKEAAGENAWNFGTDTVTGAVTLYAKWTVQQPDTFIVTFDPQGGGNVEPILNVPANTTIASPPALVRAGHTFLGWYKEAACENAWNFASDTVTENTTLYAKWEINSYTVTFDVGYVGGTAIDPVTAVYDTTITAPGGIVRGGYTFGGWYRDQGHTQAWSFDTDTVTANLTLYAKWTINTYTVSFNSNGGSAVDSITLPHGSLLTAPTPPVRDGHTFGGWYRDAGCTQAWNFAEDALSGNVTLYAKWTANAVGTFSVNFAAQGGTPVGSLGNIESGTTISAPVPPTREGYTFNGWYRESECINRWSFAADTVTDNITLYAKWSVYVPPVDGGGSTGSGGATIPADGGGSKIQIPVTVDQGTGTVTIKPTEKNLQDLISNALEKDGIVLVNLSGSKNALAAEIPRDVADALAEAGVSLTARLPHGDVTLSAQALKAAAASGKPLTISTGIALKEGLTGLQAAMSGHYDPVVNVSTSVGTAMSVGLPYTLKSGEVAEGVRAWRLNADGSRTRMAGAYDAGSKSLSFEAEGNGLYVVGFDPVALWENDYSDVAESAWYFDSVAHASYYGIFQGSNGSFDPNGTMTRAMFATVLFNLSGKPAAGGGNPFMDISEGLWYTDAVVWAYEKGVVKGVGKDAFSPDRTITRQEMMTMLLNYCAYIDCPLPELRAMSQFNDADMIADWASEAMQGLYQAGVINGKGAGEIAPADQATRAEAATLLSNFDWLVLANSSED